MANSVDKKTIYGDTEEYTEMMKSLVNNEKFSDVKFIIGSEKTQIFAHRCILSARCVVFKAMLEDESYIGKDVILAMSPDIFLTLMEFLYTNYVTLTSETAIDVLATALEYGLDDLRDLCVEFLLDQLTIENACDVMQAAVTYNQNDLKEKAMGFIEDNTVTVLETASFLEISEDTLVWILRSNKLNIDELDLIRAVKKWAAAKSESSANVPNLAKEAGKYIRLPLLSSTELTDLYKKKEELPFLPVETLEDALKLLSETKEAKTETEKENFLSACRRGTTARDHHK